MKTDFTFFPTTKCAPFIALFFLMTGRALDPVPMPGPSQEVMNSFWKRIGVNPQIHSTDAIEEMAYEYYRDNPLNPKLLKAVSQVLSRYNQPAIAE